MSTTNRDRAAWAEYALTAFSSQTGADLGRDAVHDLIADLGHYAVTRRLDFAKIVALAVSTWAYERKHADDIGSCPQVAISIAGHPTKYAHRQKGGGR
jgi:hypothetical protein